MYEFLIYSTNHKHNVFIVETVTHLVVEKLKPDQDSCILESTLGAPPQPQERDPN